MKEWNNVKKELKSFKENEMKTIDQLCDLITQIIKRRLDLELSQSEVAKLSDMYVNEYIDIELGKQNLSLGNYLKILNALNLEIKVTEKK
jgi:hypothetical protein